MDKKKPIVPRVGVVTIKDDKILLVKSKYGEKTFWIVPGGGIEFEETAEECGVREVKEETGLDIKIEKFLYLREFIPKNDKDHVIDLFFLGEIIGGELIVGEDPDNDKNVIKGVEFVPIDTLKDLIVFPKVLPELVKEGVSNSFASSPRYLGPCD